MKSIEIIVSGRVQGVCYRAFTMDQANKFNINGYAKNLVNGDVKVIAVGEDDALNIFVNLLKKGPSFARVEEVQVSDVTLGENFKDFRIKY